MYRNNMSAAVAPFKTDIHNTEEPIILDSRGDAVQLNKGLMVKLDAKASERIEISKGTLWAIGVFPVFLMVLFYWGGSILGLVRDDTTQKLEIQQLKANFDSFKAEQKAAVVAVGEDVKEINKKLDEFQKIQQERAIAEAKALGYQLKAAEAHK